MNLMFRVFPVGLIGILIFGFYAGELSAESLPELKSSMSYHDVLKLWGPPKEKEERESKREDVWVYRNSKVIFNDGKVVAWFSEGKRAVRPVESAQNTAPLSSGVVSFGSEGALSQKDAEIEDILKDIMKEPEENTGDKRNKSAGRYKGRKKDL